MQPGIEDGLIGNVRKQPPPQFPLQLVAKDLSYAASSAHGATHPIAEAVQRTVGNALASGLGEQNITALCRLYGD